MYQTLIFPFDFIAAWAQHKTVVFGRNRWSIKNIFEPIAAGK